MPEADHFYMSVLRWTSKNEVKLIAWGHGGEPPKTFCRGFLLNTVEDEGQQNHVNIVGDPEEYCEKIKK